MKVIKLALLIRLLKNWPETLLLIRSHSFLPLERSQKSDLKVLNGKEFCTKKREISSETKMEMIFGAFLIFFFLFHSFSLFFLVDCLDPMCSGHGTCISGQCLCKPGWTGSLCDVPRSQCPEQCHGHGVYSADTGLCTCEPNWMGPDCSTGQCSLLLLTISPSSLIL